MTASRTRSRPDTSRDNPVDLAALLSPRSIAVVGASAKGGRATGVIRNLVDLGFTGKIYPVNPKYETIMGLPCYPTLQAIPGPVDSVAIGIPSEQIVPVLTEAWEKGVRAAVIFASGYGEAGEVGRRNQTDLESFVDRTGMLVCGPNCLGLVNLHDRAAVYSSISPKDVEAGDVAVVSQSGSVVVALVRNPRNIRFSHIVSSGNEVGVTAAEYLHYFVDDPKTRVIAAFLEGIKRPTGFVAAAEAARRAGKPLIVLKTGRSALGSAATAAHTGSLAGSYEVQRALFRQKGIVHCEDLDEWIEAIEIFRYARPPKARGIGLVGVSGGENALVLDHLTELGLTLPQLSEQGREKLAALLPWYARPENPIDLTGNLGSDPTMYAKCLSILADEPDIGVVVVSQDSPAVFDPLAVEAVAEVAQRSDTCFVYVNNFSAPVKRELQGALRKAGVPYLQGVRESLKAIKSLIDFHDRAIVRGSSPSFRGNSERRKAALELMGRQGRMLAEDAAKQLLSLYGFRIVPECLVASPEAAAEAADGIGYPVVAKILSPDIAHKAAVGGVRLALRSADEVRSAFLTISKSVSQLAPQARQHGVLIQPMVQSGLEIILGMKRDAEFGPTILLGLGGVFVEAIREFSLRVLPISEADAAAMVAEVRALRPVLEKMHHAFDPAPLLTKLILSLSDLATELGEEIEAIDINPVIVDPVMGAGTVVDALVVRPERA
jgi:acyl-CoA synthetase (NDP forming)